MKHVTVLLSVSIIIFTGTTFCACHEMMVKRACIFCSDLMLPEDDTTLTEAQASTMANTCTTIHEGEVVITRISDHWEFARAEQHFSHEKEIPLHLYSGHRREYQKIELIRTIHNIWQWSLNPKPCREYMAHIVALFLNTFARTNRNPYGNAQILPPDCHIRAIGDLHGSIESLRRHINKLHKHNHLDDNGVLQKKWYLVFLGDYTDRGEHGPAVWNLLMQLKILNPTQVFLLRGNHECLDQACYNNFITPWCNKMAPPAGHKEKTEALGRLFNSLPQTLLLGAPFTPNTSHIECYKILLLCHGGIEPVGSLDTQIRSAIQAHRKTAQYSPVEHEFSLADPTNSGYLWSDFHSNNLPYETSLTRTSGRGPGFMSYNSSAAFEYIERCYSEHLEHMYTLEAIIRGHQHTPGGINVLHPRRPTDRGDWLPLLHKVTYPIIRPNVFTCTSSPEGLWKFGCQEDARIDITFNQHGKWQLKPNIHKRYPSCQKVYLPKS